MSIFVACAYASVLTQFYFEHPHIQEDDGPVVEFKSDIEIEMVLGVKGRRLHHRPSITWPSRRPFGFQGILKNGIDKVIDMTLLPSRLARISS